MAEESKLEVVDSIIESELILDHTEIFEAPVAEEQDQVRATEALLPADDDAETTGVEVDVSQLEEIRDDTHESTAAAVEEDMRSDEPSIGSQFCTISASPSCLVVSPTFATLPAPITISPCAAPAGVAAPAIRRSTRIRRPTVRFHSGQGLASNRLNNPKITPGVQLPSPNQFDLKEGQQKKTRRRRA